MMKIKKLFSLWSAVMFLGVSLISCSTGKTQTEVVYTINGVDVPVGIYLLLQQEAYSQAEEEVQKQDRLLLQEEIVKLERGEIKGQTSDGDYIKKFKEKLADKPLEKQEIDSTPALQWIDERTLVLAKRYVAKKELALELEVEPTQDEIDSTITSAETEYNQYSSIYNTYGIGPIALSQRNIDNLRTDKIFQYYYASETGKTPVTEEQIEEYFNNNYGKGVIYVLATEEAEDEDIDFYREQANTALETLNSGKDKFGEAIKTLEDTIETYHDEKKAAEESSEEVSEETSEGEESSINEQDSAEEFEESSEEEEKLPEASSYSYVFEISSDSAYRYPEDIMNTLLSMTTYDEFALLESAEDDNIYLISRIKAGENETDLSNNRDAILDKLTKDDFEALLDEHAKDYEVVIHDAVKKRYSAKKLNKKLNA